MKSFPAPLFVCMILAALLVGCGGPGQAITVGLKVELVKIVRGDGPAQVTWRMVNPNIVPYLLARTNHRIYLDGVLVGTLDEREAVAIPAQSSPERTNALVVAGPAGERALAAAVAAGSAAYRLESTVTFRLYGESTEKSELRSDGKVPVSAK